MSPIRKNIIANYAGSFWNALMGIAFIPIYIKCMGIEAYGLVGIFASLMALFSVLDLGLSATMTREMARLSGEDHTGRAMRDMARTLEVIYWSVALILGVATLAVAGPIATHWLKPGRLSPDEVQQALMITGGIVALRWPVSFYAGGLRGLDRQPLLNLIQSISATLKGLGAVGVLWLVSPTIQAFFVWQIVVGAVETSFMAGALWRSLPGRETGAIFSVERLRTVWRFSAGMTGISLTVLFLTQSDKIILSKMLSLEMFGYYTLAWTVSAALLRVIDPIDAGVYPTLTRLVAKKNESEVSAMYHQSCQMEVVLLVPAALVLILFGDLVLGVWSGDPEIVRNAGPILSILAIGTCLNGFMHIPYFVQLAYGWTSLAFCQNVISVVVLVPLMVMLTSAYQGIGAAYVWVILNAGYVLIVIHIMHRRILPHAKWDWYLYDVGLPSAAALAVAVACRMVMPAGLSRVSLVLYAATVGGLALLATVGSAPILRVRLLVQFKTAFRVVYAWAMRQPYWDKS